MCLVFGHHKLFAMRSGYEDGVTVFIQHSMRFYAAFFMQMFFIITGLCSSFTTQFPKFVWKNIKTLFNTSGFTSSPWIVCLGYLLRHSSVDHTFRRINDVGQSRRTLVYYGTLLGEDPILAIKQVL